MNFLKSTVLMQCDGCGEGKANYCGFEDINMNLCPICHAEINEEFKRFVDKFKTKKRVQKLERFENKFNHFEPILKELDTRLKHLEDWVKSNLGLPIQSTD
jgi:hypothetical protein